MKLNVKKRIPEADNCSHFPILFRWAILERSPARGRRDRKELALEAGPELFPRRRFAKAEPEDERGDGRHMAEGKQNSKDFDEHFRPTFHVQYRALDMRK